jgi:hypothetical protein
LLFISIIFTMHDLRLAYFIIILHLINIRIITLEKLVLILTTC